MLVGISGSLGYKR